MSCCEKLLTENHLLPITLLLGCFISAIVFYFMRKKDSVCTSVNCLRCSANRVHYEKAKQKFSAFVKHFKGNSEELERIDCSLQEIAEKYQQRTYFIRLKSFLSRVTSSVFAVSVDQDPTLMMIKGLKAEPVWRPPILGDIYEDLQYVTDHWQTIQEEFMEVFNDPHVFYSHWKLNNTPSGMWAVFHLIDQGATIESNTARCPATINILLRLKSLIHHTSFGYASFSVVYPGTYISPHNGSTNCRLRCHLGLQKGEGAMMNVGGEEVRWEESDTLLFDDSYSHFVWYPHGHQTPRAVLLFDLWHPDLSGAERDAISATFPPL